eukprot:15607736-Heterocapsa_arctica.AAC.1
MNGGRGRRASTLRQRLEGLAACRTLALRRLSAGLAGAGDASGGVPRAQDTGRRLRTHHLPEQAGGAVWHRERWWRPARAPDVIVAAHPPYRQRLE